MNELMLNHMKRWSLLCLLALSVSLVHAKGGTPYRVLCDLWQAQNPGSQAPGLLTQIPNESFNQIYPALKKKLKVKNCAELDTQSAGSECTMSGMLTALLKEKHGKKSNDKNDFLAIQYSTSAVDFERYLLKYPNSKYAYEADARMQLFKAHELWVNAEEEQTREAYEKFANYATANGALQRSGDYEGCETMGERLYSKAQDIRAWYDLADRSTGTNPEIYADFDRYLQEHGSESPFAEQAADSMEVNQDRYDWQTAQKLDNSAAYEAYADEHPDGRYHRKAKQAAEELKLWEKAQASDKYEDYCAYAEEYPDGRFVERANEKMKQVEDAQWNKVNAVKGKSNEITTLERFVEQYPSGYYASEARNRIAELRLAPYLKDAPSFNSIERVGVYSHRGYSLVCLGNIDTGKTITVSLTGPTGFSKSIKPGNHEWVRVKNGKYKILVQASNVNNWWGNAEFEDHIYADAWCTRDTMYGIPMKANRDEKAFNRILEEIKDKVKEEELNTLIYILGE